MLSNLSAIRERGYAALTKELGFSGTAVFNHHFENGSGNYTEEREEIQKNITIDEVVERIKGRKEQL
jgi:hypothetical protein